MIKKGSARKLFVLDDGFLTPTPNLGKEVVTHRAALHMDGMGATMKYDGVSRDKSPEKGKSPLRI